MSVVVWCCYVLCQSRQKENIQKNKKETYRGLPDDWGCGALRPAKSERSRVVVGDPRTMMKTMMMMNVQEKEALVSTGDGIHTSDQGQEFVTVSLSFSLHFHSIYSCIVSSILFVVLFFLGCASDAPHPHPNVEHGESRSASSSDGGAYCVVNGKWRKRSRIDAFPKRFLTLSM